VAEFTELARMFSARIEYLRARRIEGNPVAPMKNVGANFGWQSLSQFYYYVTDSGADWGSAREKLLPLEYKIYPSVLSREHAYGDRIPCIYWMKHQRAKVYDAVAMKFSGLGK
jgi:hypothetical protein